MPKLAAAVRKKVEKAEAIKGGFEVLKPGKYVAELSAVEAKESGNGNPMWAIEFTEIHDLDGERYPGRQFYNLNLPQAKMPEGYTGKGKGSPEENWANYQRMCEGRLKGFFEAFGYSVDSDTDEMIGERALLTIGVRTINNGPRTGERANSVNGVEPVPDDFESEGGGSDPDEF